jgi:hypothetical protein
MGGYYVVIRGAKLGLILASQRAPPKGPNEGHQKNARCSTEYKQWEAQFGLTGGKVRAPAV